MILERGFGSMASPFCAYQRRTASNRSRQAGSAAPVVSTSNATSSLVNYSRSSGPAAVRTTSSPARFPGPGSQVCRPRRQLDAGDADGRRTSTSASTSATLRSIRSGSKVQRYTSRSVTQRSGVRFAGGRSSRRVVSAPAAKWRLRHLNVLYSAYTLVEVCIVTAKGLRALRTRLGLTQAELADAVGVVPNTLARWERGELAIPTGAIERLDSVSRSGSSGRAVTRAPGTVLDPYHRAIVEALNGKLDPAAFEECAANILQRIWPGLVPVRGGQDDGFDGAVADGGRGEPFPLITTTATALTGNLRRNLLRAQRSNPKVDRALFATSRSVKPRMRNTLRDQAASLGVTLVQIADQDWFAQQLYRNPAWSKRLLGVSGRPRALSSFPISRRLVLGDRVLGRESQMRWLLDRRGDCLLVGSPGSGKTFLLRSLVQQGQALFKVGNDSERVADDLRELQPAAVIIDDAHLDPAQVEQFIQLRQEVGSDARIIATSWPSRADDVKSALQIGTNDVRDLDSPADLIDADTMIEIIKSTGLGGPDELLFCIRKQAPKRPGLVATLAHLCLTGDFRRVVSGDELVDQLAPQLDRMLGLNAQRLLAPFALGGDAGVRPDRVADVLGKPLFDVTDGLAQLGAAGIVQEAPEFIRETTDDETPIPRPPASVSVEPAQMRWVLVRRMFQDVGSLPLDRVLRVVEREEDALETLIGARSRGASIPELEECLERAEQRIRREQSSRLWSQYASLGQAEARYAVERDPGRILEIAPAALEHDPERVIPLLLARVRETDERPAGVPTTADPLEILAATGNAESLLSEDPLDLLSRWVTKVSPERMDAFDRRPILVRVADRWRRRNGGSATTALRVMCIALDPRYEYSRADPGAGRTIQLHFGNLDLEHVNSLAALWSTAINALREAERAPWNDLLHLASAWLHRDPLRTVSDDVRERMQSVARGMLRDLAEASREHPGVQHQVLSIAQGADLTVDARLDLDFRTLYPTERPDPEREIEMLTGAGLPDSFVERWTRRSPDELAASLARIESEAILANLNDPRWSPGLCARLADCVLDTVACANACLRQDLPADLVGPFVINAARRGRPGWQETVQRCLDQDNYRGLGAHVVLTHARPPRELLIRALEAVGDLPQVVNVICLRQEVPAQTLRQMFEWNDSRVAIAAAIGHWSAVHRQAGGASLLDDAWRQAILRLPGDRRGVSQHDRYWLGKILAQDSRLAEDWLLSRFGRSNHGPVPWELQEIAVELVPRIDAGQRERVLASLRSDCRPDKLVRSLVGDDIDLCRRLLDTNELAALHLAPLAATPSAAWRSRAKLALDHGYSVDDVVAASIRRSRFWTGPPSKMWTAERLAFEALLDDPDYRIRCVGKSGAERAAERERHDARIERLDAVHGLG